jgi:hypothetical protein
MRFFGSKYVSHRYVGSGARPWTPLGNLTALLKTPLLNLGDERRGGEERRRAWRFWGNIRPLDAIELFNSL